MNQNVNHGRSSCCGWIPWTLGVLGSFLVVGILSWVTVAYLGAPPPSEDRVAIRKKHLADVRTAETDALTRYAWIDESKGLVRLPIDRALEIAVRELQDPAVARADLIARMEKATAKPPEKKSDFE